MTATVAIQSLPSKAAHSSDNSVRATSEKNNNETSKLGNEESNSFKELYDDAKKVDNAEKTEPQKAEKNETTGKDKLDEDGKSLPREEQSTEALNKKNMSADEQKELPEDDNKHGLLVTQQISSMNTEELSVNEADVKGLISDPVKSKNMLSGIEKQSLDETTENNVSVLTGLNQTELSKLNNTVAHQQEKSGVNDKPLKQVPGQMTGAGIQSLAQRLSLTKTGEGSEKNSGLKELSPLSASQLTDDLIMGDMDKALSKVIGSDKLSLDAMLGKLDTLTLSNPAAQKQNAVIPLSTALNSSPTLIAQDVTSVNQTTITESLGKPEWNQSMSKQISWMANQHIRTAEIKLTPANLGTIEVRVEMNDDKLNVAFSSRDAGVRDSVEQAMPKLREMMEQEGLGLGETDVSEQSLFEQQEERFSSPGSLATLKNNDNGVSDDSVSTQEQLMQTMNTSMTAVDYYI